MPHLVVRQPGQMPVTVPLRARLRAGRHEQNDLVLDDSRVSREHAVLECTDNRIEIRDLDSRHGTFVNGERVTTRALTNGDQVQLGNVLVDVFEENEPLTIAHSQVTDADPPQKGPDIDRRLQLLYDTSRAMSALSDPPTMISNLLETTRSILNCERALVWLGDLERGMVRRHVRTSASIRNDELTLSRGILEATLSRREAIIVRDARREHGLQTMHRERILSAMAVPLGLGTKANGLLYVDDRRETNHFDGADLDLLLALGHLISGALENAERYRYAEAMAETLVSQGPTNTILGQSPATTRLKTQIAKYASAGRAHVLVTGESGTGKELVARALHAASPRSTKPFVTLNCAAVPETMIESEFFGHEKGAFTGALAKKRGKFVLADAGTLFLDEIGDLSLTAQAKLLRAIQEGEVQPLGSEKPERVDVRIVSATHKNLSAEVAAGRFREDLFYRLNTIEIEVPPLRDRAGDIPILAAALLHRASAETGKRVEGFTDGALAALSKHAFPGNVRELKNEVERALINADGPRIEAYDLSPRLGAARPVPGQPRGKSLAERFAELEPTEKYLVEEALAQAKGNLSEAARLLGITRMVIRRRVERFGLGGEGRRRMKRQLQKPGQYTGGADERHSVVV
jgi:Nif-specific regulatory protein